MPPKKEMSPERLQQLKAAREKENAVRMRNAELKRKQAILDKLEIEKDNKLLEEKFKKLYTKDDNIVSEKVVEEESGGDTKNDEPRERYDEHNNVAVENNSDDNNIKCENIDDKIDHDKDDNTNNTKDDTDEDIEDASLKKEKKSVKKTKKKKKVVFEESSDSSSDESVEYVRVKKRIPVNKSSHRIHSSMSDTPFAKRSVDRNSSDMMYKSLFGGM